MEDICTEASRIIRSLMISYRSSLLQGSQDCVFLIWKFQVSLKIRHKMAFWSCLRPSLLGWAPYLYPLSPNQVLDIYVFSFLLGLCSLSGMPATPSLSIKLLLTLQGSVQMPPSLWRFPHLWAITALVTLQYSYLLASLGCKLLEDRTCLLITLAFPVFSR